MEKSKELNRFAPMKRGDYLLEACVDSLDSALAAEAVGADRIELCSALEVGGITPSIGLVNLVCERLGIPVQVLLRPRGGNFVYSPAEIEVMCADVRLISNSGAAGIVTGALLEGGGVAIGAMKQLIAASSLPVTMHRAFDHVRDEREAIQQLIELGVERILTSGKGASAQEGARILQSLQREFGERINILVGGGVNARNIVELISGTGCREFHFSALQAFVSSEGVGPALGKGGPENRHFIPFPEKVEAIVKTIKGVN